MKTPDRLDPFVALEQLGLSIIAAATRTRRVASGVTQRQLGWRTGLNQSTISRLETGRLRTMRMVTLARIIGVLQLPPDLLFLGEPPPATRRLPGQRLW
jgi:transcriptional regulator with XRE-family HTH domain